MPSAQKRTMRERRSCNPIVEMSMPSITMFPEVGSTYVARVRSVQEKMNQEIRTNRSMLIASVDFPLPVRPKRPTRSLALSWKDTPCRTGGSSGAYLTTRSSTDNRDSLFVLVAEGQYAGGRFPSMIAAGSCGRSRYSTTRSTELYCGR